jgi:uncharacterized protein YbaP (TraB family)
MLPNGFQWRTPALEAALQQAQRLAFEVNLDDAMNPAKSMALVGKLGFLPSDKSLSKMLAPDYRTKLEQVAKDLGLQPEVLDRMRPWLASLTITSMSLMKKTAKNNGGKPSSPSGAMEDVAGVDMQLWKWGKAAGKELGALETAEDQLRIFADLPEDQQVELLVVALKDYDKPQKVLDDLVGAWRKGDTAALDRTMNGDMAAYPELHKKIFHDRHVKWLPQIEQMMTDGKTHVIVVGAGHLVGKDSVVDMLRQKGVKVEGP